MTQPVQEPTQDRIVQGLDFRSRQLFRRPASGVAGPPGTSPVAVAVIRYSTTATLTGPGTPVGLDFVSFKTTDASVFDTGSGSGGYSAYTGVRFLVDGAYTVQAGFIVTSATAGDVLEGYYIQGGGSPRGFYGDGDDREVYPSAGYTNILQWGWVESHDVNSGSIPAPTDPMIFFGKNRTRVDGVAGGQVFFTYFGPGDIDV